jgi:MerR family copper efflux transcriptional regulator
MRISEVAERSGVPVSTLRYYERIGLVRPSGRSGNGYRAYDESAVDRLEFIGRAKRLGLALDDIGPLVDRWVAGECAPVQDQLRGLIELRIAEAQRQVVDGSVVERRLHEVLDQLPQDAPERCGTDCGCLDGMHGSEAPAACSLDADQLDERLAQWRRVLSNASGSEGTHLTFPPTPSVVGELAELCAAETRCCPSFIFTLEITSSAVVLHVAS